MEKFSDYERQAEREIAAWKAERTGPLRKLGASMASTKPVRWISGHLPNVPSWFSEPIAKAVRGSVELLKDGAYWTYRDDWILERARHLGSPATTVEELAVDDMRRLDQLARSFFAENQILATLEGAGTGFGGLAFIAADVPAVFALAFRLIQQVGASYGFDMRDPAMSPVVLGILGISSGAAEATKAAALADMRVAAMMFAKDWSYKKAAERTVAGGIAKSVRAIASKMPQEIASNVTKKKLAQFIPLAGAAVGAGFNYWFIGNTGRTAYFVFRELYLARKYPDGDDTMPAAVSPRTSLERPSP